MDSDKFGAMGICAGGGYTANAAINDPRVTGDPGTFEIGLRRKGQYATLTGRHFERTSKKGLFLAQAVVRILWHQGD